MFNNSVSSVNRTDDNEESRNNWQYDWGNGLNLEV